MAFDRLQASPGRKQRSLDHLPLTWRYAVRIADDKELPELAALAERHIPGITNACEPARRVHLHHRGSVLAVVRDERIVGAAAFLYLNSAGLAQLRSGTFSYGAPEEDVLTLPGEPTAAIYAVGSLPTRSHDRSHRQRHALASAPSLSASRHFCPSRNDRRDALHARHRVCCECLPHSRLVDIPASPSLEFRIFQLIPGLEENDPSAPAVKSGDGHADESRAQGDLV